MVKQVNELKNGMELHFNQMSDLTDEYEVEQILDTKLLHIDDKAIEFEVITDEEEITDTFIKITGVYEKATPLEKIQAAFPEATQKTIYKYQLHEGLFTEEDLWKELVEDGFVEGLDQDDIATARSDFHKAFLSYFRYTEYGYVEEIEGMR